MKGLISLGLLATFVVSSECFTAEDASACRKENNLEGVKIRLKINPIDHDFKCYETCILERGGYIKENRDVQGDLALTDNTIDGSESRRQEIAECINKLGSAESCEEGYQVAECFKTPKY